MSHVPQDLYLFPMSFAQSRFWFLEQLEPGTSLYAMPFAVRMHGQVDTDALSVALNEVVRRHESLRTTFDVIDGQPTQLIHPERLIPLPVKDYISDSILAADAEALCTGFDLAQGPLIRALLIRISLHEHILLLAAHHIVCDGWSLQLLVREMGVRYAARIVGQADVLPPLELQYVDFACWQHDWLSGAVRAEQLRFWRDHLSGAPATLELPCDRPRPATRSLTGARLVCPIPASLRSSLERIKRQANATDFMLFFAAFHVLLARLSNATDVVVGTPFANRNKAEIEPLIGLFVNTLAIRSRLHDDPSFLTFLERMRDVVLDAQRHQDLPFELLVEELRPERNLSHSPVFQVMFVWENTRNLSLAAGGLQMEPFEIAVNTAKFDLTLFLEDGPVGLRATWEYSTALFDASTIARFSRYFEVLLYSIAATAAETPVCRLPILPAAERRQLLELWNQTEAPLPAVLDFAHLFEQQVGRTPDAVAASDLHGRLTYAQLNHQANRLANHLRARGFGPGHVVGLLLQRSCHLMIAVLASLKAGTAYVPLDSSYPADRLQFMVKDSGATLILTQDALSSSLPDSLPQLCLDSNTEWTTCSPENPTLALAPDDLAYILYTSGSTGRPKGAEITHRGLSNYLLWALREYRISEGVSVPVHSSISFDATITAWLAPLLAGVTVILVPEGGEIESLAALLRSDADFSLVKITPAHMEALRHLLPAEGSITAARAFIIGGEALFGNQLSFWQRNAPATRMINEYGPTETVVGCCIYEARPDHSYPDAVPIGRPIANTQLYVLDRYAQPVPVGTIGELFIGGAGVARGYRNRPETTAERFLPNPFGPGRLYRTGDLVRYLPDGNLLFIGRTDDQVKIRGFRVELGEVESVLARHSSIREAVVIPADADGHKRLVAYYVPVGQPLPVAALRAWITAELPEYMVPAIFVDLPSIPLTPNGKVDRRAFPAPLLKAASGALQAPSTPSETILLDIWREVLGIPKIGVHDNFFELGGDSIMSIQLVTRAREAGLPLTTRQVFQHQTISALAAATDGDSAPAPAIPQLPATGDVPLTPIQHWFFSQNQPVSTHYTQSVMLRIAPAMSLQTIQTALTEVVRHHDAVRLRFASGRQWHADTPPAFASEINQIDLQYGPLIVLRRPAPDLLFLAIHHLVIDNVSWQILLQDFHRAYDQLHNGQPVQLHPKTSSFQSWARTLIERQTQFTAELPLWREMTAQRPADYPSDPIHSTASITGELSAAATDLLLRVAPAAYQTQPNDLLLSALAITLGPETIDLESHGREPIFDHLDLSRTVGWFTALYPVRLAPPSLDLATLIPWVKAQLRRIPNGGIGYGVLRYLAGHDDLASPAKLKCNYLGRVDQLIPRNAWIHGLAVDTAAEDQHPSNRRSHIWEVTAAVFEGQLRLTWEYSRNRHSAAEITTLHQRLLAALEDIAAHCTSVVQSPVAYPLSPLQLGMLFETLRAPGSGVYVEQLTVQLEGSLDIPRFQRSWQGIVDREEALRSAFQWRGVEQPVQWPVSNVPLTWHIEDAQGQDPAPILQRFRQTERHLGFDLATAPLLRFGLIRVAQSRWFFIWTYHHLILDGWSTQRVIQAVVQAYNTGEFPPPAPPYRTYIDWIGRQDRKRIERFWRAELDGFDAPTPLVIDSPAPEPGPAVRIECSLFTDESAALQQLARGLRLTVNTLVQGAWALLLARYSRSCDVLFGVTVAGRPPDLPAAESITGLFINTLPLRVRIEENTPWTDWLRALQTRQRDLDDYSHASLMDWKRWSAVPSGVPLFESVVVFENFPAAALRFSTSDLTISHAEFSEQTNIPLVLVAASGPALHLALEFDSARFSPALITRLGAHLQNLLRSLPSLSPDAPLSQWSLFDPHETHRLLIGCNLRQLDHGPVPASLCVHQLITHRATQDPDAIAIVDPSGRLSYADLIRRANQVAHRLVHHGVGPESIIGVCMERSADVVIAILAIWKAGAAYVPLDPAYPPDRITFMVQDSATPLVLTHSQFAPLLQAHTTTLCLDVDPCSTEPTAEPPSRALPHNLAYLIYTSGSTGIPKGVMIEHRSCVEHCLTIAAEYGHTPASRILLFVPLSFDQSVEDIFPTLLAGASLILPRPGAPPTIGELLSCIQQQRVTMLHIPTAYWHEWSGMLQRYPVPPSLTTVKVGGELAPLAAFRAWEQNVPPGVRFVNGYGPTEVTVTSHVFHSTSPIDPRAASVPIGRTLPNTYSYILDSHLRLVPYGLPGELFIGGLRVARGYHQRPDLTAERFLPNPFGPGNLYRTGDLVRYLDDGSLEFLGRLDQQVKIRGHRIETGEIETLLNHHPAVRQAAVTAVPGPSGHTLCAYFCLHHEHISADDLRQYLAGKLPAYMIPSHFVRLDALPTTPSGKLDRRRLPAPGSQPAANPRSSAPPRDAIEQQLTLIWEDVLTRPVAPEDDFFALGGDSLAAIRLMARIEHSFGVQLPLSLLFQHPNVAAFAAHLRTSGTANPWSPLVILQPRGHRIPLFCIHGGGGSVLHYHALATQLGADQPFYALQALGLDGVTPPLRTIADMASLYLSEIRKVQPAGPYRIGGHSLGGHIAYEIARQLVQSGHTVDRLIVIDTYAPGGKADTGQALWDNLRWIREFIHVVQAFLSVDLHIQSSDLESRTPEERLFLIHNRLLQSKAVPPGTAFESLKGLFAVFQANNLLHDAPPSDNHALPVPILLLRGRDSSPSGVAEHLRSYPDWGWSTFSAFPIDLRLTPGDHIGMITMPYVLSLAREIDAVLHHQPSTSSPGTR